LVAYWRVSGIGKVRKELGANVRSFRKKAALSQERLAEMADLHPAYISQVERGTKASAFPLLECLLSAEKGGEHNPQIVTVMKLVSG
jgi:predicted transcriptional regulator